MSSNFTEDMVKTEMTYRKVGYASRIDFTEINKKPGFKTKGNVTGKKSAFIHFDAFHNSEIHEAFSRGLSYRMNIGYPTPDEYWIILPARNPIPRTMMNVHQIVENCRFLEEKIEEQQEKISKQDEKIKEQQERISKQDVKIELIKGEVLQLLGGLYNHNTQGGTLDYHVNKLFDCELSDEENTSKWNYWPTTRQGDANEKRIEELQTQLRQLTSNFNGLIEYQGKGLMTTRKLENSDSKITSSSMPSLVSNSSSERIRNSYDLCGNE
jgi:uncharacterized coiled-coil protein SlyX